MSNVSNLKKFFEEQSTKVPEKSGSPITAKPSKPVKPTHLTLSASNNSPNHSRPPSVKVKPVVPIKILATSNPNDQLPSQNPFLEESEPFITTAPAKEQDMSQSYQDLRKVANDARNSTKSLTVNGSNEKPGTLVRKVSQEDVQRSHILKELYDSEASFLSDMKLLQSIYIFPAKKAGLFSAVEMELLFGNVDEIIKVSSDLLIDLDQGIKSDCIGPVFKKHVSFQYLF
jgi:hypothetical protein